jgi:hypothetical protein
MNKLNVLKARICNFRLQAHFPCWAVQCSAYATSICWALDYDQCILLLQSQCKRFNQDGIEVFSSLQQSTATAASAAVVPPRLLLLLRTIRLLPLWRRQVLRPLQMHQLVGGFDQAYVFSTF